MFIRKNTIIIISTQVGKNGLRLNEFRAEIRQFVCHLFHKQYILRRATKRDIFLLSDLLKALIYNFISLKCPFSKYSGTPFERPP